jgi:long-chain acyl-CoA synthetase
MNGYHEDPDATAACTTDDGFLTCGDVVVRDEEGYIHIVDRKKDLIISGGVNVYPREIEDVLIQHPAVLDAAVVGTPSSTWGEEVAAYVVLRRQEQGRELDDACRAELEAHCRDRLAGYKIPRHWAALDALPRNAGGKVLKRELRDQLTTSTKEL